MTVAHHSQEKYLWFVYVYGNGRNVLVAASTNSSLSSFNFILPHILKNLILNDSRNAHRELKRYTMSTA